MGKAEVRTYNVYVVIQTAKPRPFVFSQIIYLLLLYLIKGAPINNRDIFMSFMDKQCVFKQL